jgi:hypothetical protein
MARPARRQPDAGQHFGDRLHHQLVLVPVFDGAAELISQRAAGGGAGQGVAAQLALAHGQQPFR